MSGSGRFRVTVKMEVVDLDTGQTFCEFEHRYASMSRKSLAQYEEALSEAEAKMRRLKSDD